MELINRFGAVPWVNTALNENSPEAYGPRVDREIVADSVLNRLKWAEANIEILRSKMVQIPLIAIVFVRLSHDLRCVKPLGANITE